MIGGSDGTNKRIFPFSFVCGLKWRDSGPALESMMGHHGQSLTPSLVALVTDHVDWTHNKPITNSVIPLSFGRGINELEIRATYGILFCSFHTIGLNARIQGTFSCKLTTSILEEPQ